MTTTHFSCVPPSDYLADSVDAFLTSSAESQEYSHNPNPNEVDLSAIPLGLTFSFPVEQTALDKGILLTWTKGFSAKNAVHKDVVKLLQDAFDRKHLHVKCVALVNDVCPLVPFNLLFEDINTSMLGSRLSVPRFLAHTLRVDASLAQFLARARTARTSSRSVTSPSSETIPPRRLEV